MNHGAVLADLYRRLNFNSSPASTVTTRLSGFVNDVLQEVLSEPGIGAWLTRHEPPTTVTSVNGQAIYTVPGSVQRMLAVTERTNNLQLKMRDLAWYRRTEPNPTINTGTPACWVPLGFMAVALQPSAAAELFVKSTAGGDVGTAYLEGIRTGGYPRTLSVTMNGVTAVSFAAAITDLIEVTKFYISVAAVGTVTLNQGSGAGTELARIPIGQTFARYRAFALWPTPAAPITYYIDGERDLTDMSNSTDESPLPPRLHELLIDGVLAREFDRADDDRAPAAIRRYQKGVSNLKYFVTCPPDLLPSRSSQRVQRSHFGGYYPADKW